MIQRCSVSNAEECRTLGAKPVLCVPVSEQPILSLRPMRLHELQASTPRAGAIPQPTSRARFVRCLNTVRNTRVSGGTITDRKQIIAPIPQSVKGLCVAYKQQHSRLFLWRRMGLAPFFGARIGTNRVDTSRAQQRLIRHSASPPGYASPGSDAGARDCRTGSSRAAPPPGLGRKRSP